MAQIDQNMQKEKNTDTLLGAHPIHYSGHRLYIATMSIVVNHLQKNYGDQVAVNQISFEAVAGRITGFLGPNGAGKSTTMKIICGYLLPTAGDVSVCGHSVVREALKAKSKIGYLPESNALYTDLYIREYLHFIAGVYRLKNAKHRVETVMHQVGLHPEASKKIGQLSKGYKQRVGLAAAIIHDPEVLVLDEPTSGLDPNQIVEIRAVINSLASNKTVLMSTHILQEVQALCQQVVIINRGSLVANDSLENLSALPGRQVVRVSFAEPLEAEWLRRLPSVTRVEQQNAQTWQIEASDPGLARREIMQLAIAENLNVVSIQQGSSLEEVFRSLTENNLAPLIPD
jgi:ABC-2 type transport system ATP-binding protein